MGVTVSNVHRLPGTSAVAAERSAVALELMSKNSFRIVTNRAHDPRAWKHGIETILFDTHR